MDDNGYYSSDELLKPYIPSNSVLLLCRTSAKQPIMIKSLKWNNQFALLRKLDCKPADTTRLHLISVKYTHDHTWNCWFFITSPHFAVIIPDQQPLVFSAFRTIQACSSAASAWDMTRHVWVPNSPILWVQNVTHVEVPIKNCRERTAGCILTSRLVDPRHGFRLLQGDAMTIVP